MNCSMPGFPVHYFLELAQVHVHWVSDATQPSHSLSPPSHPAFNLSHIRSFPLSQLFVSSGQCIVVVAQSLVCPTLPLYGLQHVRVPCPSPSPRACSNSCPLSQWCHPNISSSVIPFSSFPASRSFLMSQLFVSGGQSIRASASVSILPMTIHSLFPLGLTGWISLLFKGLSRVFSNITVQKHLFFGAHPSLWSKSHIHT